MDGMSATILTSCQMLKAAPTIKVTEVRSSDNGVPEVLLIQCKSDRDEKGSGRVSQASVRLW